ncbi:L-aspartate oxidase [Corynebacterium sp. 335C]
MTRRADHLADWRDACDLLVVGGGVAGLSAARRARELGLDVLLVDAGRWTAGARPAPRFADAATNLAQGGLAVTGLADAPGGPDGRDTVDAHVGDTLDAGGGHCDEDAVRAIIGGAAEAVTWLIGLGARFDEEAGPDHAGAGPADAGGAGTVAKHVLCRTREGGHTHRRIVHAGGDRSGAEIQRALEEAVAGVRLLQNARPVRLVRDDGARVAGAVIRDPRGAGLVRARATLLATGGVGQLYRSATAPAGMTGGGHFLALEAGAELADMEFVQFHPTVLFDERATGRRPLISEAVRGEGARLVDSRGRSVTDGADPRGDLAPRDIVSRAIATRLRELGETHVFLDARGVPDVRRRFPTVTAACDAAGYDPAADLLPVAPAVHYTCGGIATDARGATRVGGLFVAGECARTGLHGANRLASNSLLEGLVVGRWVAEDVAAAMDAGAEGVVTLADPGAAVRVPRAFDPALTDLQLRRLRDAMSDGAGVTRTRDSLLAAREVLDGLPDAPETVVARVIVEAALARPGTLGCHTRLD